MIMSCRSLLGRLLLRCIVKSLSFSSPWILCLLFLIVFSAWLQWFCFLFAWVVLPGYLLNCIFCLGSCTWILLLGLCYLGLFCFSVLVQSSQPCKWLLRIRCGIFLLRGLLCLAFVVALLGRGVWDRRRSSTGRCWAGNLVWSSVLCCFSSVLWLFHLSVWRILSLIGPLLVLYCVWFWSIWWVRVWCEFWLWGLYLFSWSFLDSFLILHFGSGRRGFRLAILYHRPSVRPGIWCMLFSFLHGFLGFFDPGLWGCRR